MTENILGIILTLLYTLMNYAFLRSVLKRKADKSVDYILIFSLFVLSAFASILLRPVPIVKMVLVIVATIVVTVIVFKISIKKSILVNLIYSGIYTSVEMMALLILQKVIRANEISEITDENGAFIAELICQFIVLIIIIILSVVFKKNTLSSLDFKGWLIFALFPLFTLVTIVVLIYGAENRQIGDMFYKMVFFATGLLSLNLLLFLLLDNVIRREGRIREKEMLIEQSEHLNQMYRSLSEEREKQKARSHDYLNHLQVMLMLAREGKLSEEIQYIEEQLGQEMHSVDIIDTGNTLINAVLNIKYFEAKEKGIVIPFIADELTGLHISDSDLVTILTNILDNAIEAVQLCDDKRIVFKIIKDKDMLIIDSSNPYVGQIPDGETVKTTKQDKDNHGYGIANIRQTVESNNGNCFIETQDGIFHITIAIPFA